MILLRGDILEDVYYVKIDEGFGGRISNHMVALSKVAKASSIQ